MYVIIIVIVGIKRQGISKLFNNFVTPEMMIILVQNKECKVRDMYVHEQMVK